MPSRGCIQMTVKLPLPPLLPTPPLPPQLLTAASVPS